MKNLLILFLTLFTCLSCSKKGDCEDMACFTPPPSFVFEIVAKESGENLFANGTYDPNQIKIINLDTDSSVDFTFLDDNDANLITIHSIGWKTEIVNLKTTVSDKLLFNLYVDAERKTENCCSFTELNKVEVRNTEFQRNPMTGIYTILVE